MSALTVKTSEKKRLSIKTQTLATIGAIIAAVALPQLFHLMGAMSGLGTALGEAFLPMHLPIILVGLLAGPYAGAVSGLLSPLVSFGLSGMPTAAMLPFMMIELCAYGLIAGILRNASIPTIVKILIAQFGGRFVRAIAILISVYAFGNEAVSVSIILMSVVTGIFGLALQWALIPLIVYRVENTSKNEK